MVDCCYTIQGHLVAVLTALESKDAMDVHALLKALQTTLRFEQVGCCCDFSCCCGGVYSPAVSYCIYTLSSHYTPLQTTLRFEQEMATRFGITAATLANNTTSNTTNNTTTTTGSSTNSPVYPGGTVASTSYNGSNNGNGNGNSNDKEERRLKSQDKLMYVPTFTALSIVFI